MDLVFYGKCLDLELGSIPQCAMGTVSSVFFCAYTLQRKPQKKKKCWSAYRRLIVISFTLSMGLITYGGSSNTFWCLGLCVTCKRTAQHVELFFFPPTFKRLLSSKRNSLHMIF